MAGRAEAAATQKLDAEFVGRLCGDLLDTTVAAIVETGGSVADLEAAMAFIYGESDTMGEERRPLSGAAALIYDLIIAEQDTADER